MFEACKCKQLVWCRLGSKEISSGLTELLFFFRAVMMETLPVLKTLQQKAWNKQGRWLQTSALAAAEARVQIFTTGL
jgi:hypothetical protein